MVGMVDFGMYPCVLALNRFFDALPPCHFQSDNLDLWLYVACLLLTPFFFPRAVARGSDAMMCICVGSYEALNGRQSFYAFTHECAPKFSSLRVLLMG